MILRSTHTYTRISVFVYLLYFLDTYSYIVQFLSTILSTYITLTNFPLKYRFVVLFFGTFLRLLYFLRV